MNNESITDKISELFDLFNSGALSEEEYNFLKSQIISGTKELTLIKTESIREEKPLNALSQKDALEILSKMDIDCTLQNLVNYSESGYKNKVELLLIAGLNPNESWFNPRNRFSYYPLHQASGHSSPDILKLLIEYKAEVNKIDQHGYTPIFYAIEYGNLKNVEYLIENGADVNFKFKNKLNPLQYALNKRKQDIVELLKRKGALNMTFGELRLYQITRNPKKIIVVTALLFIGGFISYNITNSKRNSSNSIEETTLSPNSSSNQFCNKHKIMYNPNNPWRGCPKCAEEDDLRKYEKAIEKSRHL